MKPQTEKVLQALQAGYRLSMLNARMLCGTQSLPKRICELADHANISKAWIYPVNADGSKTRMRVYYLSDIKRGGDDG